jgi:hypothetical protein
MEYLLEITKGNITPDILVKISQDIIELYHVMEKLGHVIMWLDLRSKPRYFRIPKNTLWP